MIHPWVMETFPWQTCSCLVWVLSRIFRPFLFIFPFSSSFLWQFFMFLGGVSWQHQLWFLLVERGAFLSTEQHKGVSLVNELIPDRWSQYRQRKSASLIRDVSFIVLIRDDPIWCGTVSQPNSRARHQLALTVKLTWTTSVAPWECESPPSARFRFSLILVFWLNFFF